VVDNFFVPKWTGKFYTSELAYNGSTLRVKSLKASRQMATNPLSNRKPGARSRNFRPKPEPEVVLAAILDSEVRNAEKVCENDCRMSESLYLVSGYRPLAPQFWVPVPDRKWN